MIRGKYKSVTPKVYIFHILNIGASNSAGALLKGLLPDVPIRIFYVQNEQRVGPRGGPCLLAETFGIRLWAEPLSNVAEGPATRGQCRGEGLGGRGGNMVNPGRGYGLADAIVSCSW